MVHNYYFWKKYHRFCEINFLFPYLSFSVTNAVKEFLETAKEEFEEKWKNPYKVSTM